jgi:antitoxin YefM
MIDVGIILEYNISTKKRTVFSTKKEVLSMIAAKQMDIRANIKKYFDLAFSGEPIIVSRKENKNVVVISEKEYNELQKAKRNAEYLAMLDKSIAEAEAGGFVTKTIEELEAYE